MRPSSATAATRGSGFGERLREARERRGLSQRELADAIDVSKDAVSQWERGVTGITWKALRTLTGALDCSEDWLLAGDQLEGLPPGPAAEPASAFMSDMQAEVDAVVVDGAVGAGTFLVRVLLDLQSRLERIEAALEESGLALGSGGDDLVDATRQTKALLAEGLDDDAAAPASPAEPGTPREGDATTG